MNIAARDAGLIAYLETRLARELPELLGNLIDETVLQFPREEPETILRALMDGIANGRNDTEITRLSLARSCTWRAWQ